MIKYVGSYVSELLQGEPFKHWPVERSVDDDLDEILINYIFDGHGLSVICDNDERIRTVFLHADDYGSFREPAFEIPFSTSREGVLKHFGTPSKSGGKFTDPVLGEYGGWDRFSLPYVTIHVEYKPDADEIKLITLMRNDVVPK